MTYGIEIKNKNNRTLFGINHLGIKKMASGTVPPQYYNSRAGVTVNPNQINYPAGVTKHNALVFARPALSQEYLEKYPDGRLHGFWPMAVTFNANTFSIIAPDESVRYYDGIKGDKGKKFTTSSKHYNEVEFGMSSAPGSVYYEVWIQGQGSTETGLGLEVKDNNNDIIFDSNTDFFKTESTVTGRPNMEFITGSTPRLRHETLGFLRLPMLQTSEASQQFYLALLNGTAHCSALAKGGDVFSAGDGIGAEGFEVPQDPLSAYYRSFVEFHFEEENNLLNLDPEVRMVPRLAYTKAEYTTSLQEGYYSDIVRVNTDLGVLSNLLIGKSI